MAAKKSAREKLNPKQQHLIDLAGQIDPKTGHEYSYKSAAIKVGYAPNTADSFIHSAKYRWVRALWDQQADKMRTIRQQAAERGAARAEEKRVFDVLEQARFWASFDYKKTGGRIQGQVNATRLVAEMEGRIVNKTEINDLRGKPADELEFIRVHKRLPVGNELQEFIASCAGSPAAGPTGAEGSDGAGGSLPS